MTAAPEGASVKVGLTFAKADEAAHADHVAENITLYGGRISSCPIDITVVGCGLGGLAAAYALSKAGHRVTILEAAPAIGEVGAGIQVTSNVSKLLIRWGLRKQLESLGVVPAGFCFRRWENGEMIGYTSFEHMFHDYGTHYYHLHRADFHRMLYDLAVDANVKIRLNSTVVTIDPYVPSCALQSGEVVKSDLIIGADGVKSMIREVVVGHEDKPVPTGDAAYRALLPTDLLLKDPELAPFVNEPQMTIWMGPKRHIVAYCVRGRRDFNLVLAHPDDGSVESWTAEGSADKMRNDFDGWEPRVQKLLSLVPSTLKWRLMDRMPLEKWVHDSGKVVLLGDSCHPMLPYRAQGAAMAIEDAAFLGNIFSRLEDKAQIPVFLRGYEAARYPRTSEVQASARLNQKINHLVDGPEQQARDSVMKAAMEAPGTNQDEWNQWSDKRKGDALYGYDADAAADQFWNERLEKEGQEALQGRQVNGQAAHL
ncbi:FAD/NAD(P)-binding domain-containing protein [Calocera viscosa TUFC12733]|uniref:FAD/NAD(P)-binding domain-containing protein n=1 Tax=Calocera viscosa (strain TUFC12733) TaxID=1330018 RepID=A0A167G401_CALVF|nr:FAD/NAD(P)-binding domain-containing protein [Calocera viscosa TUFC12733]